MFIFSSKRVSLILILVCLLSNAPSGSAASEAKRVLLVHSFGRDLTPLDVFAMDFRPELDRQLDARSVFTM
jgi:hypothetical protein